MSPLHLLPLALTLLAGPSDRPFEPTGEVQLLVSGGVGSSAAWDVNRVVGPSVNMARDERGGWAGSLGSHGTALVVTPTQISGTGVSLRVEQRDGLLRVEGLFFSQRVRVELEPKQLASLLGGCSGELKRVEPGLFSGQIGCLGRGAANQVSPATLRLTGQAAGREPPMPQLAFALLAVLLG